jgi:hypothetical protein
MTHYSNNERSVRVDFWKSSGKWYCTEAVQWIGLYRNESIHMAFARSLKEHLGERLKDMVATCLEPYHEHCHPISMRVEDIPHYLESKIL